MADETTTTTTATTTPAATPPATTPAAAPKYDEIFAKLDSILDKRTEGLAKSALKDNGTDETEISEIVKAYRESKQAKASEQTTAQQTLAAENAKLKAQIADKNVDDAIKSAAATAQVDAKTLPYLLKLVDRTAIMGTDGNPDQKKITDAITQILTDVPALKVQSAGSSGFQAVGASGQSGSGVDGDEALRKAFGLPPKK